MFSHDATPKVSVGKEGLILRLKYIENSKRRKYLTDDVIMSSYVALNYWQTVKLMKYYKAFQFHSNVLDTV